MVRPALARDREQSADRGSCRRSGPTLSAYLLTGLILLGLAWTAVGCDQDVVLYDEALTAYPALRLLAGDVVYRDFFTLYGPAEFYLVALLFMVTGPSLIALRLLSVAFNFLLCLCAGATAWQLTGKLWPAAAAALFLSTWMVTFSGWPNTPALLFGILSSLMLAPALLGRGDARPIAAGALVAASMLFRHDVGLATAGVHLAVCGCFMLTVQDSGRRIPSARSLLRYIAGAAIALVPPVAYLLWNVPAARLAECLLQYPAASYAAYRELPYPFWPTLPDLLFRGEVSVSDYLLILSEDLQFHLPIVAFAAALLALRRTAIDGDTVRRPGRWWLLALMTGLHAAYSLQASVRSDSWHLLGAMTTGSVLSVFCLDELARRRRWMPAAALAGLLLFTALHPLDRKLEHLAAWLRPGRRHELELPRGRGIWLGAEAASYERCIRRVMERVPPGAPLYVGNRRHDRVVRCDVMLYFLAERDAATRHFHLIPGLTTRGDIQTEMVRDLEESNVEYLVLVDLDVEEPNESSRSSGVHLLDDFIRRNFTEVESFGPRTLWRRTRREESSSFPRRRESRKCPRPDDSPGPPLRAFAGTCFAGVKELGWPCSFSDEAYK